MRSLKTLETLSLVTVALLSAASAGAQPVARPPVEIGAGAGALVSWWGAVGGADLRATFPVNARHAVETFVAVAPIGEQLCGLYGIQVKRVIRRSSDSALQRFLTFGVAGGFARYHEESYRYTRSDGSVVTTPERTDTSVGPPVLGMFGVGVQQRVAQRLSVRVEAQAVTALFLPVGARVAVGVAVPLGPIASSARMSPSR